MTVPEASQKLLDWIKTSIEESPGQVSAIRVMMVLGLLDIFAVWTWCSVKSGHLEKLDYSVVLLAGLLVTGKVAQKFGEG